MWANPPRHERGGYAHEEQRHAGEERGRGHARRLARLESHQRCQRVEERKTQPGGAHRTEEHGLTGTLFGELAVGDIDAPRQRRSARHTVVGCTRVRLNFRSHSVMS